MAEPPTIIVRGKAAEVLYDNVRDSLHLLEDSLRLPTLDGEERYHVELRLCAFLQTMLYGEYWPKARGYASNHDYFLHLDRSHGDQRGFLRLKQSRKPLAVVIDRGRRRPEVPLSLGYAEGITTVIPLSESGYKAFIRQRGPRFDHPVGPKVRSRYVAHPTPDGQNRYLYIGTMFHLSRLNLLATHTDEVIIPTCFPSITVFCKQLYRHINTFIPRLVHNDYFPYVAGGGRLPILCFSAADTTGHKLAARTGFEALFSNQLHHTRYRLDLSDIGFSTYETARIVGGEHEKRVKAAREGLDGYFRGLERKHSVESDHP